MKVSGFESVEPLLDSEGYVFKLLANDLGVIFFPRTTEHRDVQIAGLRYADDSGGNALAAMVVPGRIEFRFHQSFSDERVRKIADALFKQPELEFASGFEVTYQGRLLIPRSGGQDASASSFDAVK